MSPLAWLARLPIKFYRKFISPMLPAQCKYYPTCSCYALNSLEKHGFFLGIVLTAWRLLRCNPWSLGGIDPVPDKVTIDYFRIKRNNK
ncbi:membrane protein insertion efficiency factor YidD [Ruminococcus sp.]|uniref:membrane protein insertion efficiency factor YidD n=1 Tax=Ruminococcus sp. TaxID=41978 RepID=UPI0025D8CF83|nr:membrane protein insertion efficiency factor YidD [Ruminococcus sp.]MBQ8967372.1 membrane protein insertion efficiency factor YidD [Ruminococcus sp.]